MPRIVMLTRCLAFSRLFEASRFYITSAIPVMTHEPPSPLLLTRSRHLCAHCNTTFSRPSDLQRHCLANHGTPRFNCVVSNCARHTKGFSRKDKLMDHLRSCHNIVHKTATIPWNSPGLNDSAYVDVVMQAPGNWLAGSTSKQLFVHGYLNPHHPLMNSVR